MVEGDEAAVEFFVAHQQLAKAVEPAVTNLDHPAPGFLVGVAPLGGRLLGATHDVGDGAVRLDDLPGPSTAVAGVRAQVFVAAYGGHRTLDRNALQYRVKLGDVIRVGSCRDEGQRDPTAIDQEMTLAPIFFPDRSDWVRLTLAPAGP